jgi:hypothetical protein
MSERPNVDLGLAKWKNITKNITTITFIYKLIMKNTMFFNNVYLQNSLQNSW